MGDMNCKRKEWNCPKDNTNGNILLEFCLRNKIGISAPLNCTNFPPVGKPSIIDIFLFKNNLNRSLPLSLPQLSSNHNPVHVEIAFKFNSINKTKIHDYAKADWKNFKKNINEDLNLNFHITEGAQLEEKCDFFIKIIQKAIQIISLSKNLTVMGLKFQLLFRFL